MARQELKRDRGTDRRPRHSACTQARRLRPATPERRELGLGEREGLMVCPRKNAITRGRKVLYAPATCAGREGFIQYKRPTSFGWCIKWSSRLSDLNSGSLTYYGFVEHTILRLTFIRKSRLLPNSLRITENRIQTVPPFPVFGQVF